MQDRENLVSIITPVYNGEAYVKETIESVLKQSYTQWEMILVDDCSTDCSEEIIRSMAESDARIRYYRNETNLGAADSRNRAIELAKGRYIAFLDSDDMWKEDKLKRQLRFMKERNVAFCYTACEVIDETGAEVGKVRHVPTQVDFQQLIKGNVIPCLTVVLDREAFTEIRMPRIGHEDYATWLGLLQECGKAEGIDEVLASYRVAGGSLSGNKLKAAGWTWKIYRKFLGLGLCESIYLFCRYAVNAVLKRV